MIDARINLEPATFNDPYYRALERDLGKEKALYELVRFWGVAQSFWKRGELVPFDVWDVEEFPEALKNRNWAIVREAGIYARGAESQFDWLRKRVESGRKGGIASGASRLKETNDLAEANAKQNEAAVLKQTPSKTNPLTLTLTPTLSLTPALTQKELRTKNSPIGEAADKPQPSAFIAAYVEAFQKRYPGARPDLRGKVQGQVKALLRDYSLERATQLVQVYLQMDGSNEWFKRKGHDFGTFIENLSLIEIAMAKGSETKPGQMDWSKVFKKEIQ